MNTLKNLLLLLLATLSIGLTKAQNYVATQIFTLSGAAAVLTIQQPASVKRAVKFVAVDVESTASITFDLERDGGGATTTQFTPVPLNPGDGPANTVGFTASNVGSGVVVGNYTCVGNGFKLIDLSKFAFQQGQSNRNFTIRTSSTTGTVTITITWLEQQQ